MNLIITKINNSDLRFLERDSIKMLFRDHMEASQNISMWLFIEKCKTYENTTCESKRYTLAKKIYLSHIEESSKHELNLSQKDKEKFIEIYNNISLSDCPKDLFKNIKNNNLFLIGNEIVTEFFKSKELECYFYDKITDPQKGVPIKDRRYNLVKYKKCFVGKEFIDWLMNQWSFKLRDDAINVAEILYNMGWFEHINGDNKFKDEILYYRMKVEIKKDKVVKITKKSFKFGFPSKIFNVLKTPRQSSDNNTNNMKRVKSSLVIGSNMKLIKSPKSNKISIELISPKRSIDFKKK